MHSFLSSCLKWNKRSALLVAILAAALILTPTINNDWVNWDDESFVINNRLVTEISFENVKEVFSGIDDNGGYTPLVLLSWSLNYSIDEFNASVFHTTNVLIHLINVWLVFVFIFSLTGKKDLSFFTAILFGIHPTQLEAVAWVTARKDLLYGMFYLAGLLSYIKYLKYDSYKKKRWLILCLLLFLASLLSKGMAVTFPIALMLIDYYKTRTDYVKVGLEKVPFLALSILFGVIASVGQNEVGAVDDLENISFIQSFFVACYSLVLYVLKAGVPFHLSAYHPYPFMPGEAIPWYVYGAAVPATAFIGLSLFMLKRNKNIAFGMLFFLCSIVLVLQFFPVGIAIVAERFSYVASIGLFFVIGYGLNQLLNLDQFKRKYVYGLFSVYLLVLGSITFNRTSVWYDSESLWTDVIRKYPTDFLGYNNRAMHYANLGKDDLAILDYSSAVSYHGYSLQSYYDRGLLYLKQGDFANALSDFDIVVSLDGTNLNGYLNRGLIYMNMGEFERAERDFARCIKIEPKSPLAYFNRGLLYSRIRQNDLALKDLSRAVQIESKNFQFRLFFARALALAGNWQEAINEFEACIAIDPQNAEPHFEVGQIFLEARQLDNAVQAFSMCVQLDPGLTSAYVNLGLIYLNQGKLSLALEALDRAVFLDPRNHLGLFNRGLVHYSSNRHEKAVQDFTNSLLSAPEYAPAYHWRALAYKALGKLDLANSDAIKAKGLGFRVEQDSLGQ